MAETIIVCTIFAFIMVGIILAINRSFVFLDNTRILVRATNFARGGVEMVYNIRDSNRQKHAGARDKFRLSILGAGGNDNNPGSNDIFKEGRIYAIKEGSLEGNPYVYAEYITDDSNFYEIEGFFKDSNAPKRNKAKITFTGTYKYFDSYMVGPLRESSMEEGNMADLLNVAGVEFYRVLRVYGVYCKNSQNPSQVVDASHCNNESDPKEMRFCVKVFFKSNGNHATELCSIMTNFEE